MKIRFVFLLLLLFTFAITSQAQSPDNFTSGEGGFGIDLPSEGFTVEDTPEDEAGLGYGKRYTWLKMGDKVFIVTYYIASDKPMTMKYKNTLSEGIVLGFTKGSERKGYKVTRKPYAFNGNKGVEFRVTMPGVVSVTRFFVAPTRIYLLQVTMKAPAIEAEMVGVKTLDSLRLLTRAELIAAKTAESMPKELPQLPAVQRVSTDVLDAGLKGRVRSVIRESAASGKSSRVMESEIYFDRSGNSIRKIEYLENAPWRIFTYGFVDNMRVSNSKTIMFDLDQQNALFGGIVSIAESKKTAHPPGQPIPEPRFSEKYEYKYDNDKRLLSETEFDDKDKFQGQTIIEYSGSEKKTSYKTFDGSITNINIEKLDALGRVIEETVIDTETGKGESPISYAYDFDAHGNWIVRRATQKLKVRGKTVVKNLGIHYRTILYYI